MLSTSLLITYQFLFDWTNSLSSTTQHQFSWHRSGARCLVATQITQFVPHASSRAYAFWARTALGMMLISVPASCLLPGYLARLTINIFTDSLAIQDSNFADMMWARTYSLGCMWPMYECDMMYDRQKSRWRVSSICKVAELYITIYRKSLIQHEK